MYIFASCDSLNQYFLVFSSSAVHVCSSTCPVRGRCLVRNLLIMHKSLVNNADLLIVSASSIDI